MLVTSGARVKSDNDYIWNLPIETVKPEDKATRTEAIRM